MWSSHLFRTFCRKVYRPNCQVFQGVQRFSKITASRPVAVSRTQRATNCATPRFVFCCKNHSSIPQETHTLYQIPCEKSNHFPLYTQVFVNFSKTLLQDKKLRQDAHTSCRALIRVIYAFSSAKRCFISYMPASF